MSIENNLKRIADALETIANGLSNQAPVAPAQPVPASDVPAAPVQVPEASTPETVPTPPAPPAAVPAASTPTTTPTPAPPTAQMTAEQLNEAVVAEFKGGKDRDAIMAVFAKYSANGVSDLAAEHYAAVLAEIRSL